MSSDIPKSEFTDVDSTPDPRFFVQALDRQNATVPNLIAKQQLVNLLDICFANRVFQHLSEPRPALAEIVRVIGTKPC